MKYIKYNILWIIWAVIIYVLMSISGNYIPEKSFLKYIPFADKIIHAFLFGVLVVLLNNSFLKQYNNKNNRYYAIIFAIMISVFYAGVTEILQEFFFVRRNADIMDFIADLTGIIIATFVYFRYKKF